MSELMPIERIEGKIYLIRGQKVMLDYDLAELYMVPTKRLNESVKRNIKRFPVEFMFQLTEAEVKRSRSQFATLKRGENIKYRPYAFNEQGVAMLSSVLNSERAIAVNIMIIKSFVRLRQMISSHKELARQVEGLEKRYAKHEVEISVVFKILKQLMVPGNEDKPKRGIGFLRG